MIETVKRGHSQSFCNWTYEWVGDNIIEINKRNTDRDTADKEVGSKQSTFGCFFPKHDRDLWQITDVENLSRDVSKCFHRITTSRKASKYDYKTYLTDFGSIVLRIQHSMVKI